MIFSIGETINREPEETAASNRTPPRRDSGEDERPRVGGEEEHRSPTSPGYQKSALVSFLIKLVKFYNELTVLLWRLAELHISKLVNFILICVVVNQVGVS